MMSAQYLDADDVDLLTETLPGWQNREMTLRQLQTFLALLPLGQQGTRTERRRYEQIRRDLHAAPNVLLQIRALRVPIQDCYYIYNNRDGYWLRPVLLGLPANAPDRQHKFFEKAYDYATEAAHA